MAGFAGPVRWTVPYKGDGTYRGVTYQGSQQPIIPAEIWYQVQAVLRANKTAAEATQVHDH
ncbi:MAG: hypothetical protein H0V19_08455 [Euzebyales bacterium]|nr:hypothetical protein [Euzebyales bacterium]